jgi:hypothetical protein
MSTVEASGYILRIKHVDWLQQIFELKKYYSGILRKWRTGTPILFVMKTEVGDSFVAYGIVDKFEMLWEMSPEEEYYCKENGWRCAISFKPLIKFSDPLPLKETFLVNDERKGSFLHGITLTQEQVEAILEQTENS